MSSNDLVSEDSFSFLGSSYFRCFDTGEGKFIAPVEYVR